MRNRKFAGNPSRLGVTMMLRVILSILMMGVVPVVRAELATGTCECVLPPALVPFLPGEISVGGEIGQRMTVTVDKMLHHTDIENVFVKPFRERKEIPDEPGGFAGYGMFLDGLVKAAAHGIGGGETVKAKTRLLKELEALCASGRELYTPGETGLDVYAMYGRPFGRSFCHAWGASPIYLLGRYYLGVRPTAPGFAKYCVSPCLGGLRWMEGSVPTPLGDIEVSVSEKHVRVRGNGGEGTLTWNGKSMRIPPNAVVEVDR